MDGDLGHRARKRARTKRVIADALVEALRDREYADVTVDELALAGGVSRATFFNHFATKEEVLDFAVAGWMVELNAALERTGLEGIAAIERAFELQGEKVAESPRAFTRILGAVGPMRRPRPTVTLADRAELDPEDPYTGELLGIGEIFMREVDTARRRGDLRIHGSTFEIAHYLGALLVGSVAVGHSQPSLDWRALHRNHARRALLRPPLELSDEPP